MATAADIRSRQNVAPASSPAVAGISRSPPTQTLAWVKEHPADAHNADLIGFAMRVIRNACRSGTTAELNHQLFELLHRRYPNSEWARKYTTWQ